TVQAEQQVLARIDQAGTRSIVVVDVQGRAGLRSDAVERVAALSGVEWVVGLGPARDVTATGIPGGSPAPTRVLYGALPAGIVAASPWPGEPGTSLVGPEARGVGPGRSRRRSGLRRRGGAGSGGLVQRRGAAGFPRR
ncbi:MAG: hypothetical protein ACRDVM_08860, partial [Acidimicrobiia bacterium]